MKNQSPDVVISNQRRDEVLKRMLKMKPKPHAIPGSKPHSDPKVGKKKPKKK